MFDLFICGIFELSNQTLAQIGAFSGVTSSIVAVTVLIRTLRIDKTKLLASKADRKEVEKKMKEFTENLKLKADKTEVQHYHDILTERFNDRTDEILTTIERIEDSNRDAHANIRNELKRSADYTNDQIKNMINIITGQLKN